jgi:hypothetical protein
VKISGRNTADVRGSLYLLFLIHGGLEAPIPTDKGALRLLNGSTLREIKMARNSILVKCDNEGKEIEVRARLSGIDSSKGESDCVCLFMREKSYRFDSKGLACDNHSDD